MKYDIVSLAIRNLRDETLPVEMGLLKEFRSHLHIEYKKTEESGKCLLTSGSSRESSSFFSP